jgi:hypothetical protein
MLWALKHIHQQTDFPEKLAERPQPGVLLMETTSVCVFISASYITAL